MFFSRLVPVFAFTINCLAQDTTAITGISEDATPTGRYLSYSSTITRSTATAITTSVIITILTGESTTRTRTLGTTTIFGLNGTPLVSNNATGTQSSTTTSQSQIILQGSSRPTLSLNGTQNATSITTNSTPRATNTRPCNNYVEFCERSYANITEVAAHNSPFIRPGNAASNQELDVIAQLNDGVRLLQGQMHFVNGTPHFCHGSCDVLDAGPITTYLGKVYQWVLNHPFDVVTLLLGNARKEDDSYRSVLEYVPFLEQTGLQNLAYEPPKIPMAKGDWPTLAQMILSGRRVVIFMDYEANQTAVPWVLDEFSQMWETPFDPTDRAFPCTVQRPPDLPDDEAKNRLYLINHNLNYEINLLGNSILVPVIPLLNVTNNVTGYGSLGLAAQQCDESWGAPPKFLNVDYYNVGDGSVFEVAAKWNNVTYGRECCGLPASEGVRAAPAGLLTMLGLAASIFLLL